MTTLIRKVKTCLLTKTIICFVILDTLLLAALCCYHFVNALALFHEKDYPTFMDAQQGHGNRPLCLDGILTRQSNKEALLMDGEDPSQNHGPCRLHHYQEQDVATCLDELSFRRSRHQRPVHIAFIGESTARNQFTSLLRVYLFYSFNHVFVL